ncbi:MAG: thiamine phosphate synthase [Pirellulaceae bacterium]|nr:thiamine phosphate synthase [Pirellulaceae bacterium]
MSDDSLQAVYRILDASVNRAGEGLRTLEEFSRFVLNDSDTTAQLKSIRHDLTAAIALLDRQSLLLARDTPGDVGTTISVESERSRGDLGGVIAAAAARTQQSLRVIEEYSKTIQPAAGERIEQVRYRCYELCAALELRSSRNRRHDKLDQAQLYVLIDAGLSEQSFVQSVQALCNAGVDILQLRDRQCDDRTLYLRSRVGSQIARENDTLFIVNDRADLASAADADGVHVGQDELPANAARQIVGPNRLIGVSTHDVQQVHDAITAGADYIGCGPVFAGATKQFDDYVGTDFLRAVHDEPKSRPLPAFAIGGIDADNVDQVRATGFHRIAVTGAIRDAADPTATVAQLKHLLSADHVSS